MVPFSDCHRQRKLELGLGSREVFVPQSYDGGQEAQVDWFEAMAKLDGESCKLQFFAMRSMASGDAFTQRYDNMTSLVEKIRRGRQRCGGDRPDHRIPFARAVGKGSLVRMCQQPLAWQPRQGR